MKSERPSAVGIFFLALLTAASLWGFFWARSAMSVSHALWTGWYLKPKVGVPLELACGVAFVGFAVAALVKVIGYAKASPTQKVPAGSAPAQQPSENLSAPCYEQPAASVPGKRVTTCTSCGQELPPLANFCPSCGSAIPRESMSALHAEEQAAAQLASTDEVTGVTLPALGELPQQEATPTPVDEQTLPILSTEPKTPSGNGAVSHSRSRRRLIVALVVAAIAGVALAGALFALNAAHSHRRGSAPGPGGALSASTPASTLVTATLPVHVLHTAWGITPAGWSLLYPASVTVQLPRTWADKVAAYGVVGMVLLAPAGWTESNALIGADGGRSAWLHATGTSPIVGQLTYEGYWSGNALWAAAPYFPWVRAQWNRLYSGSESPPAARPGLVEHLVGNQLAEYSLTSGPQVDDGLQVNGVAHMTAPGNPEFPEFPEFDRLEVALPPSAHTLATAILNYYLSPDTSAIQGVSFTLGTYFDAINSHDYQTAWQQFTPQQRHVTSANHLATTTSTVHDSDIVIHDIRMIGSRKAVAFVTFTSTQDPSQGPNGDTQDNWTLDYWMKLVGWQWLIDDVGPHAGSTHKPA